MEFNGNEFVEKLLAVNPYKTQAQLEEAIDVSYGYISKLINRRGFPKTEKIIKMAQVCNCSVDYLLGFPKTKTVIHDDIRDYIRDLFVFAYRDYQTDKQNKIYFSEYDWFNFEFDGLQIKDDCIKIYSKRTDAIKELLTKFDGIQKTFGLLDSDQVISLIDKAVNENKEKYIAVEYVGDDSSYVPEDIQD